MRLVIADTGPVNYLILIGQIEILPKLFEKVVLPSAVQSELMAFSAPLAVRNWIGKPPAWLEIHDTAKLEFVGSEGLDEGEASAIALASFLGADLLLMDERAGTKVALARGIPVTGTLGILDLSAERGLLDFAQAIQDLEQTNFWRPMKLLEALLRKHRGRRD